MTNSRLSRGEMLSKMSGRYITKNIISNLFSLYKHCQIAHLDLKPDNIMFQEDLTLTFIDFGSSGPTNEMVARYSSTPNFYPPELTRFKESGDHYAPLPVDIFNLGTTVFILLFG